MTENDEPISPENKMIAKYAAAAFGGVPRVGEYANASETLTVGILCCRDRPCEAVTSYSTVKLSDHPMIWPAGEFPTRLELAGLCANTAEFFPNMLASAAFRIMQSHAICKPGSVIHDCARQPYSSSRLPHLYLTAPFLWEQELRTLDCGTKKVSWLLAMLISDAEYRFLKEYGDTAFERLLESQNIDISNPQRPSVL